MVKTAHAQVKIAKKKRKPVTDDKTSTSYTRKSMSLTPFPVTDLRPEV